MREIVVFGRQPVAGRVKTRLAAGLGEEAAAGVYRVLLEHTLRCALASGARVTLSVAEPPSEGWTPFPGVRPEVQCSGDLGRRMLEAFRRAFARGASAVVLVGSDCPGLETAHLLEALDRLEGHPVVLGPAADGGYWLVGQRPPGVDCFAGVPWSSGDTLRATRERLRGLGVPWAELEVLRDVDTLEDLEVVLRDGGATPAAAARLAPFLDRGPGGEAGR